jgi:hypothetical protein
VGVSAKQTAAWAPRLYLASRGGQVEPPDYLAVQPTNTTAALATNRWYFYGFLSSVTAQAWMRCRANTGRTIEEWLWERMRNVEQNARAVARLDYRCFAG